MQLWGGVGGVTVQGEEGVLATAFVPGLGEDGGLQVSLAEVGDGAFGSKEPGDIRGQCFNGILEEELAVDVEDFRLDGWIEDVDGAAGGHEGIDLRGEGSRGTADCDVRGQEGAVGEHSHAGKAGGGKGPAEGGVFGFGL